MNSQRSHLFLLHQVLAYSLFCLGLTLFLGCSHSGVLKDGHYSYSYQDVSGDFILEKSVGEKNDKVFVKSNLYREGEVEEAYLERSILLSIKDRFKKVPILTPYIAQNTYWFDGKKYFSQVELSKNKNEVKVTYKTPNRHLAKKVLKITQRENAYCFWGQLFECVSYTRFFELARKKQAGDMQFYIIWDSYPFNDKLFQHIPNQILSKAVLKYDGVSEENGWTKYMLTLEGQTIFFHVNNRGLLEKKMWVVQGITQSRSFE